MIMNYPSTPPLDPGSSAFESAACARPRTCIERAWLPPWSLDLHPFFNLCALRTAAGTQGHRRHIVEHVRGGGN